MCGRLLVAPNNKPKRSNQYTEFAADLFTHGILLTTSTHALKFCYQCKHVMRVVLIAQMRVQVAEMRLVLMVEMRLVLVAEMRLVLVAEMTSG